MPINKSMMSDLKERYGKDAKSIYYAIEMKRKHKSNPSK